MKLIKRLIVLLAVLPLFAAAQDIKIPDLVFDKVFYDCENQWVVFPKKPADSAYAYGVIYIDATAGFTFDHQGMLKVGADGVFIGKPLVNKMMKYRLESNISQVSLLSPDRIKELGLPREAEFLKHYKVDPEKTSSMVSWGRHYNHVGAYDKALVYLLKAYSIAPHAAELEFELAYNYNATQKFDKALEVLTTAIKHDQKNYLLYKELGYLHLIQKKLDDAEKAYLSGIDQVNNDQQRSEMAYNMAYGFFQAGNKPKFSEWYEKTKQYITDPNSVFLKNLGLMNGKLDDGQ